MTTTSCGKFINAFITHKIFAEVKNIAKQFNIKHKVVIVN